MSGKKALVCIVGPTGAGKTAAALHLAKKSPCSIINMDSRQLYADFPIITAQPSVEEQRVCPHLLYGFLPCSAKMSAGEYVRMASGQVEGVLGEGRAPIFVGGTGLYAKAFFVGMADIPATPADVFAKVQARCKAEGSQVLYRELAAIDPKYAAKIHPHDKQRTARALEVFIATGKTFSWWHERGEQGTGYKPVYIGIGLSLAELEPLLARRIDMMLANGAIEEARAAMLVCSDRTSPGWSGIGCQELYEHLCGEISLDECRSLWLKNTRAYAKRQLTWFRGNPDIPWFAPNELEKIDKYLEAIPF